MVSTTRSATGTDLQVVPHQGDVAAWNAFVAADRESTYAHHLGWKEVMESALGHRTTYLEARDAAGKLAGVLPLVEVRSRIFGSYLVSIPFVNYGGPLGTEAAQRALAAAAVDHARRAGVGLLELRGGSHPFDEMTVSDRKVTVLLELQATSEAQWKWFPSKLRSQIRRAQKEEMEVRLGAGEVDAFYDVFARNMRDLGTPVLPKEFFSTIASALGDEAIFGVVYFEDQPVAAGLGFLHHDRFEITWASALREFNRKSPNMLLYWSLMEQVIERGAATFDFGRCTPGGNTHRFKLQWGGESIPLGWPQWSPSGVTSTPSPDRPIFQLATRAWSKLPLPVANRLGPMLSRQLP